MTGPRKLREAVRARESCESNYFWEQREEVYRALLKWSVIHRLGTVSWIGILDVVIMLLRGHPVEQDALVNVEFAAAEVCTVLEVAHFGFAFVTAEAIDTVWLLYAVESSSDVFEFIIDVQCNFAESDNQSENCDCWDKNKFSRNNETGFVVEECIKSVHRRVPYGVGWVIRVVVRCVWCERDKANPVPIVPKQRQEDLSFRRNQWLKLFKQNDLRHPETTVKFPEHRLTFDSLNDVWKQRGFVQPVAMRSKLLMTRELSLMLRDGIVRRNCNVLKTRN